MRAFRIRVLGSGGWEGIPAPFCKCRVCDAAGKPGFEKDHRFRPCYFVEGPSGAFLLEAGFDLRLQTRRFNLPPLTDFLISHWHPDHMWGLFELGSWSRRTMQGAVRVWGSPGTTLTARRLLSHTALQFNQIEPLVPFELAGVKITPIPVMHFPINQPAQYHSAVEDAFGFVLEAEGRRVAYLGDYYDLPSESRNCVRGCDVIIADGTYLFEELFPPKEPQRSLAHDCSHCHGGRIFELLAELQPKQVLFHSVTHLAERTHEEMEKLLPLGHALSYDGLQVSV